MAGKGQSPPDYPHGDNPQPNTPFTFPGTDIYADWALGVGKGDFFPSEDQRTWIPVLLELKNITPMAFANGVNAEGQSFLGDGEEVRETWLRNVVVSRLYLRQTNDVPETLYLTALATERFFREFLEGSQLLQGVVSRVSIGTPPTRDSLNPILFAPDEVIEPEELAWPDLTGNPPSEGVVVVGIIDDGIPFGHARFWRDEAETRVEYVWLQDNEFDALGTPPELPQGTEFIKTGIDTGLANATHGGVVDEDDFYRRIGAVNFDRATHKSVAQRVSHGGHVMDVATGYDYRDPNEQMIASDRPIICVQLPTESTADTSGRKLEPHLTNAIRYIRHRADLIAEARGTGPIPVVINFSYGHNIGPHDGSSEMERSIEQEIDDRMAMHAVPLRVVVPSGNSHLSRTHAQISFDNVASPATLEWRVLPDDKTWSFMEIWMPPGAPANRMTAAVSPPMGPGTPPLAEVFVTPPQLPPGGPADPYTCRISYRFDAFSNRGVFLIALAPTERLGPSTAPTASSGIWKVELTNQSLGPNDMVNAWIFRDDTPFGFPIRGRQSYFDHECYQRFDEAGRPVEIDNPDCEIKRADTISGIATSDGEMIVIGGYCRKDERPAEYSAGGPTNGTRNGPDAMAVSDDSVVHQGILAAGTRSGSVAALNGTSVAAPQVTRCIADDLAAGLPGDRSAAAGKATPFTPPVPAERGGAGKIDRPPIVRLERLWP